MSIEAASRAVAEAKQAVVTAEAAVAEAVAERDTLTSRLAALQSERSTVITAARGGADQAQSALRLAVIEEDLKDLVPIVADAEAAVRQTEAALTTARQRVVTAEQHLQIAADIDLQAKLETHATELAGLLWTAVGELNAVWKRRVARPTWAPQDRLVYELERLRLTAKPFLSTQK